LGSLELPQQLLDLAKTHPLVSMCVLHWIGALLTDRAFTKKGILIVLLPVFLQVVVEASERYPLQRPDCCAVLEQILLLSPDSDDDEDGPKKFEASSTGVYTVSHSPL
jgi:hypothetical protein